MKIEIVCTYFERLPLLIKTVESLKRYTRKNFELVVIDDGSVHDISIPGERTFPICVIKMMEKTWTNSAIPFNRGFRFALSRDPDIIIIQNAECYHAGDILGYAEKHLTDKNYISFPCYSLSKNDTLPPMKINNRGAAVDGDSAWYNHPDYRPVG